MVKVLTPSLVEDQMNNEDNQNHAALTFVKDLGLGINIGNTLDSIGTNTWLAGETGWGNPKITREIIRALKNYGYKTIRLPVTWAERMGPSPGYIIEKAWMDRAEEVVKWILDEDLFCILNIHHDGGESDKSWILKAANDQQGTANQLAIVWKQIAQRFSGYSKEKLIFETFNEVGFDKLSKNNAYNLFNNLNQTALDTIRATGGANAERYLLIAGYWTDIDKSCDSFFKIPQDTIEDRLILSVHYYTPSTFCIAEEQNNSWGFRETWGTNADLNELNNNFRKLKTNFLDKGVPVILGEYGVTLKNKKEESRILWMKEITQVCLNLGICPILWDTGGEISRYPPYAIRDSLKEVLASISM
jgi:endoglucanase